jgi:peptidyl-prolyl cis-trans isomerase SurA
MTNGLVQSIAPGPHRHAVGARACLAAVGWLLSALTLASSAKATVVERVVAVVGDQAILLSDVRSRATPYLMRVQQEMPTESHRAAAITQLHKSLLEQLIDEELIARTARRSKLTVTDREVDQALSRVAQQNGLTMEALMGEITAAGLTEAKYREELRRQILDARVLSLRVATRVQVREEDLRATYRAMVLEERKQLGFDCAWIVLNEGDRGSRDLADALVRRARGGESFEALARQHSVDTPSRARGGAIGRIEPGKLAPVVEQAAQKLEIGEVSEPLRLGSKLVVIKILGRDPSKLPDIGEARAELSERVYGEKMAKARRRWLDGLRKQAHVEVRL